MLTPGPYTLQCDLQDARGNSYYLTYQNGIISFNSGTGTSAAQIIWSPNSAESNDGSIALGANNYMGRQSDSDAGTATTATTLSLIPLGTANGKDIYMIRIQWTFEHVLQTAYLGIRDGSEPGNDLRFFAYAGNLVSAPRKQKWIFMPSQPQRPR